MDALATALADLRAKGITPKYIYTIPTVQNPTGTIMPETRRAELNRTLRRNSIDAISLRTGEDYLPALRSFFKQRERRLAVR